jgi:hypothetical protein
MATREELIAQLMVELGFNQNPLSMESDWLKGVSKLGSSAYAQPTFEMSYDSVTPRYADGLDPNSQEMIDAFVAIKSGVSVDSILETGNAGGVAFTQQNIADLDKFASEESSRAQARAKYGFNQDQDIAQYGLPDPSTKYNLTGAQIAGLNLNRPQNIEDMIRMTNASKTRAGMSAKSDPNMNMAMAMAMANTKVPKAKPSNMDRLSTLPQNAIDSVLSFFSGSKDKPVATNAENKRTAKVQKMAEYLLTAPKDRQQAINDEGVYKAQQRMVNIAEGYDQMVADLVNKKLSDAGLTPYQQTVKSAVDYQASKKRK